MPFLHGVVVGENMTNSVMDTLKMVVTVGASLEKLHFAVAVVCKSFCKCSLLRIIGDEINDALKLEKIYNRPICGKVISPDLLKEACSTSSNKRQMREGSRV